MRSVNWINMARWDGGLVNFRQNGTGTSVADSGVFTGWKYGGQIPPKEEYFSFKYISYLTFGSKILENRYAFVSSIRIENFFLQTQTVFSNLSIYYVNL